MTIKTLGQRHDPHLNAKMVDLGGIDVMPLAHEVSDMMQGMGELRGAIAKRKQITEWLRELAGDHGCVNKDVEIWLDGLTEPTAPPTLLYLFLRYLADRIDDKDFGLRVREPPGGWAPPEPTKGEETA